MRFATCLLAALLASTAITTQIASACGGYESVRRAPQVMVLSSHEIYHHSETTAPTSSRRAFAITRTNLDLGTEARWQRLSPMSYDYTSIIELATLKTPATMTLVGPSGTRVVRGSSRVALHNAMFISGSQFEAVEVPIGQDDHFEVALAGNHRDAVWHDTLGSYTYTNKIAGTNLEATSSYTDGNPMVQLSAGGIDQGTYEGYVAGAVDVGGARYVVLRTRTGTAYTVEVTK